MLILKFILPIVIYSTHVNYWLCFNLYYTPSLGVLYILWNFWLVHLVFIFFLVYVLFRESYNLI